MFNKKLKNQKAFTLAETLITLTLIGVVAAMTIPVLKNVIPSETRIKYKKAYYTLQRANDRMLDDDTIYPNTKFYTYKKGTIIVNIPYSLYDKTDYNSELNSKNKYCYYLQKYLNTYQTYACPTTLSTTTAAKFATTMDGIDWYIKSSDSSTETDLFTPIPTACQYNVKIIVDVNGSSKAPNCMSDSNVSGYKDYPTGYTVSTTTCKNPDTFIFGVRYDGKLRAANSSYDQGETGNTDAVAASILSTPDDNTKK